MWWIVTERQWSVASCQKGTWWTVREEIGDLMIADPTLQIRFLNSRDFYLDLLSHSLSTRLIVQPNLHDSIKAHETLGAVNLLLFKFRRKPTRQRGSARISVGVHHRPSRITVGVSSD